MKRVSREGFPTRHLLSLVGVFVRKLHVGEIYFDRFSGALCVEDLAGYGKKGDVHGPIWQAKRILLLPRRYDKMKIIHALI